jgi:acetyl-CoA carboxylase biotin carboxyl carrier protein
VRAAVAAPEALVPAPRAGRPPLPVAEPAAPLADAITTHPGVILSPMVGVAYLSPEPGAPTFVTLGQAVAAGQTLLLIEAMKTFNQIKAPKSGTIARILIATGVPVEYGEPLMIVES